MAIGSPDFPQIFTVGTIRRCMKQGSLQVRTAMWAFCTDTSFTVLGTAYPKLPFDINISLVQTRYHGDSYPRILAILCCRPYTALHETGFFAGPYCEVGFLHQNKVYNFGHCIPSASFSYKHSIVANTIPWR